jgi:predicted phosphodiesterase
LHNINLVRDYNASELLEMYEVNKERNQTLTIAQFAEMIGKTGDYVGGKLRSARVARGKAIESGKADEREQVRQDERANELDLESKSARITTLAQLLAFCAVDLDEWMVESHTLNKWEIGAKTDEGEIVVEPLYQVKAFLKRRNLRPVWPHLNPVVVQRHKMKAVKRVEGAMRCALVVFDAHFGFSKDMVSGQLLPYHDRRVLDNAMQIAQRCRPEMVIFGGDVLDFAEFGKYPKRPENYFTTQPAIIEAAWWLRNFKTLSERVIVMAGNHDEARMNNTLMNHLVAAYGLRSADNLAGEALMSIPNLLGLESMGVEWVGGYPDADIWLNDVTRITHGSIARGNPGATSGAYASKNIETVVFGHTHRRELSTNVLKGRYNTRTVTAANPGAACHVDYRVPGHVRTQTWNQGLALVYFDDEFSQVELIPIEDGRAWWQGRRYEGVEDVSGLVGSLSAEYGRMFSM